jgi:hypothetical protein
MAAVSKRDPVRSLANRGFLMISGRWFRAYSIVRHVGRTSGRAYQNPVSAYPLGDGFVIPVLYGTQSPGSATSWRPAASRFAPRAVTTCWSGRSSLLPGRRWPPIRPCYAGS